MQSPVEGAALVSGMVRSLLLAPASVRNAPLLQCCWMMHLLDGFFSALSSHLLVLVPKNHPLPQLCR